MSKSIKLKGGQAVVQALKREKTKHVFGLIGSSTMEIFDALYHEKSIKLFTEKVMPHFKEKQKTGIKKVS